MRAERRLQAEAQLRAELDSLLRLAVVRPYGLAWADVPETERPGGPAGTPVSFEPGGTPAAGLVLLLAGQLLEEERYTNAAIAVARGISVAMDANGRVPGVATFLPGQVAHREPHGLVPRREPTTASLGLLLALEQALDGRDARVSSTAVRASTFLIKQQLRSGAFLSTLEIPGARVPRRVIRFDQPLTRDAIFALLLIDATAEKRATGGSNQADAANRDGAGPTRPEAGPNRTQPGTNRPEAGPNRPEAGERPGGTGNQAGAGEGSVPSESDRAVGSPPARASSLPQALARVAVRRGIDHLLRARFSELGVASRHMWPAALEADSSAIPAGIRGLEAFPPAGSAPATRNAAEILIAHYLFTGDRASLDAASLAAEALVRRREPDGLWSAIDPASAHRPPGWTAEFPTEWDRSDFGVPPVLRLVNDVRILGRGRYPTILAPTASLDTFLTAILTGVSDTLPGGDLPLSRGQIAPFLADQPGFTALIEGPEPTTLRDRTRRLWALYLLARWEMSFRR